MRSFPTFPGCLRWSSKCHKDEQGFGKDDAFPRKQRTVLGTEQAPRAALGRPKPPAAACRWGGQPGRHWASASAGGGRRAKPRPSPYLRRDKGKLC